MVVAFLQTLLVMLRSELSSMDAAKASGALTETRAAPRPNTVEMPNTVAVASEGASGVGGAV
jgi:hypothetical protein